MKKLLLLFSVLFAAMISYGQTCNIWNVSNVSQLNTALSSACGSGGIIRMAAGTYTIDNELVLCSNVTLEGGYNAGFTTKSSTPGATTILRSQLNPSNNPSGGGSYVRAIVANAYTNFRLQDLTITVANASAGSQRSNYAIYLNGCSNYTVARCIINSGNAGSGSNGGLGSSGANGGNGLNGNNGDEDNETLNWGTRPGGSSACCPGGFGGSNSWDQFFAGAGGTGGCGGGAGGGPGGDACNATACSNPGAGGNGQNGSSGGNGSAGSAGSAGSIVSGFFVPGGQGAQGSAGGNGTGGGGGGGGGAEFGTTCNDGSGGQGGSGGGGGCGGTGGTGGTGGGATYCIFVISNGANGNLLDNQYNLGTAGNGGTGGNGGSGGSGGSGGAGGWGGSCNVGRGGNGGNGGNGGSGGQGGAGQAGVATSVTTVSGTSLATSTTLALSGQPVLTVAAINCTNTNIAQTGCGSGNLNYLTQGIKTVTACSGNTYTNFITINADYVTPSISAGGPTTFCAGGTVTISVTNTPSPNYVAGGYVWRQNGNIISGQTGSSITVSASGTYTVTGSTPCCGVTAQSAGITVTVNPIPNSSFAYATAYCQQDADPTPTTSQGGGTFTATPAGLSINASTGIIDVSASTPGTYAVTYAFGAPCPASSSQNVTINATGNSNFNYGSASYCQNGSDPSPTVSVLGGTFTSVPAGLSINAGTGAIDVSASTANTYTITYNSGGTCATTTNRTVTITATDDASFSFGSSSYCKNAGTNPLPTVTGLPSGLFSATAGLVINSATGEIDLVASTAGGPYTVTYLTTGPCPNSATQQVTILPAGNSTFSFAQNTYCKNATNPTPSISAPGGTFTATAGLVIDGSTGQIDLNASTAGGPYTVTYTSTAPCQTQSTFTINITPADNPAFSYSTNSYCTNGTNPVANVTGLPGGVFSAQSGLFVNSSTGEINLAASTPGGPYNVTYTTTGACPASATFAVSITGADNPAFSYTQATYCQNAGTNPVAAISGLPGGTFTSSPVGLSLNPSTGEIDLLASTVGGPYTVTYTTTGTCAASQSHTVSITVADNSSFAFADATICINGTNPTPTITGLSGGIFSATPSGLDINASTGLINLANSTVNTPFTVTYLTTGACPTSTTQSIILLPAPVVSFSGLDPEYCISEGTVNLAGSPAGGSFSGLGVIGNTFSPTLTVAGPHVITYSYTDGNACSNTSTQTVQINGLPFVSLSGLATSYCTDNTTPVALNILPVSGGTLSGPGVSGTDFVPANAGTGFVTVTYTYTDANGCANTATQNTVVNALPVVGISGLANAYCVSASPVNLAGIPNGGTFSGTGISGNTFDPAVAGIGTFTVTYAYTDGNSCSNSTTQNVTVNDLPVVSISNLASAYCEDAGPINLIATPPGGSFTGIGVSNNQLFPSIVNGNQTLVTYTYTDGLSCSNSTSQLVTINDLPAVSFSGLNPEYCVNAGPVTLTGTPGAGTFSGAGISGTTFDPATAGVGTHVITFAYTDGNTCSNSTTQTVVVNAQPFVAISNVLPCLLC